MATETQIAALRAMIGQPENAEPWTDEVIGALIDTAGGDLNLAAYNAWLSKAATASSMVDISEGGSSRKMSDLHKNALAMAAVFKGQISPDTPPVTGGARLYRITR